MVFLSLSLSLSLSFLFALCSLFWHYPSISPPTLIRSLQRPRCAKPIPLRKPFPQHRSLKTRWRQTILLAIQGAHIHIYSVYIKYIKNQTSSQPETSQTYLAEQEYTATTPKSNESPPTCSSSWNGGDSVRQEYGVGGVQKYDGKLSSLALITYM